MIYTVEMRHDYDGEEFSLITATQDKERAVKVATEVSNQQFDGSSLLTTWDKEKPVKIQWFDGGVGGEELDFSRELITREGKSRMHEYLVEKDVN